MLMIGCDDFSPIRDGNHGRVGGRGPTHLDEVPHS